MIREYYSKHNNAYYLSEKSTSVCYFNVITKNQFNIWVRFRSLVANMLKITPDLNTSYRFHRAQAQAGAEPKPNFEFIDSVSAKPEPNYEN